jgi:hypothetical protein
MNQDNNEILIDVGELDEVSDILIKKEEESLSERLKQDPFFHKMVKEMLVDYVANSLSHHLLSEKYHISVYLVKKIATRFKFESRKKEYDKKLLDTVLSKAQKQQTAIIAKITMAINNQVNRLIKMQEDNPDFLISSSHMKDLIASLTIFSKEYRLDNDQLTDSVGFTVKVEYPTNVPIITNNNQRPKDIETEAEEVKEIVAEEQKKESIQLNEAEPSVSNSSFFGSILE